MGNQETSFDYYDTSHSFDSGFDESFGALSSSPSSISSPAAHAAVTMHPSVSSTSSEPLLLLLLTHKQNQRHLTSKRLSIVSEMSTTTTTTANNGTTSQPSQLRSESIQISSMQTPQQQTSSRRSRSQLSSTSSNKGKKSIIRCEQCQSVRHSYTLLIIYAWLHLQPCNRQQTNNNNNDRIEQENFNIYMM